jgi:hypothetical protein
MSIDISIDSMALSKRIGMMIAKIDHLKRVDIGIGLSEFQTEDMHRNRPFTMRSRAKGMATTKIRPHSLYEMEHSARASKRVRRFLRINPKTQMRRRRRKPPRIYLHYSNRPILREEMFSIFVGRMTRIFEEKIKW